jgi:hypothetical protein
VIDQTCNETLDYSLESGRLKRNLFQRDFVSITYCFYNILFSVSCLESFHRSICLSIRLSFIYFAFLLSFSRHIYSRFPFLSSTSLHYPPTLFFSSPFCFSYSSFSLSHPRKVKLSPIHPTMSSSHYLVRPHTASSSSSASNPSAPSPWLHSPSSTSGSSPCCSSSCSSSTRRNGPTLSCCIVCIIIRKDSV